MTPLEFERRYRPVWNELERLLERLDTPAKARVTHGDWQLAKIPPLYREA